MVNRAQFCFLESINYHLLPYIHQHFRYLQQLKRRLFCQKIQLKKVCVRIKLFDKQLDQQLRISFDTFDPMLSHAPILYSRDLMPNGIIAKLSTQIK